MRVHKGINRHDQYKITRQFNAQNDFTSSLLCRHLCSLLSHWETRGYLPARVSNRSWPDDALVGSRSRPRLWAAPVVCEVNRESGSKQGSHDVLDLSQEAYLASNALDSV